MDKGKFGLRLSAYAVVAFVLALLGQILLCGLVAGFVLVKEGDEKTARQCLTAFFASIAYGVLAIGAGLAMLLGGALMSGISYRVREGFLGLCAVLLCMAALVLVIFIIIGLAGAAKGKEASVPIFSSLADKAFGYVRPRPQPAYPQAPGYPPQPPAGQGYYPPQPGQAPYAGPPQGYPAPPPAPPVPPSMVSQGLPATPPAPQPQPGGDAKPGDNTKPGEADE